jgi:hypothetical protein
MYRLLAVSLLVSSAAFAEDDAKAIIQNTLVTPLKTKEAKQSRFSRARMPPQARRVRVLEEKTDSAGEKFVSFAIDSSYGMLDDGEGEDAWSKNTTTGCVYVGKQEVFVKFGATFRPAAALLGKKTDAADASVCKPTTEVSAR